MRIVSKRDLLKLVFGNLNRMKFRTILTSLGVVIGTLAVVLLISLGAGMQRMATEQFLKGFGDMTQIQVYPSSGGQFFGSGPMSVAEQPKKEAKLDDKAVELLKSMEHVEQVLPEVSLSVTQAKYQKYTVGLYNLIGVEPRKMKEFGFKVKKGRLLSGSKGVVLGSQVPKNIFTQSGKKVKNLALLREVFILSLQKGMENEAEMVAGRPGSLSSKRVKFKVVGILKSKGMGPEEFSAFASLKTVQKIRRQIEKGKRRKEFSMAIIKVDNINSVKAVGKRIRRMGYNVLSLDEMLKETQRAFLFIQAILGGIGSIALLVAAFGIANTMTMAIYERTKEIGIMKAIGASGRDVMQIFLTESATIGFMGGFIGTLSGYGIGKLINAALLVYYFQGKNPQEVLVTPVWLIVFAVGFATLIGLVSGIYPALRASRLSPLGALRYE